MLADELVDDERQIGSARRNDRAFAAQITGFCDRITRFRNARLDAHLVRRRQRSAARHRLSIVETELVKGLFDDSERDFVLALADQTAQALARAQLQAERIDVSRRLQRSLLPPELPETQLSELYEFAMSFVERQDHDLVQTLLDMNTTIYRDSTTNSPSKNRVQSLIFAKTPSKNA